MIDVRHLDPFTPIYRGRGGYHHRSKGRVILPFHLRPDCPVLTRSGTKTALKGRLGAMLAHGRHLCTYEAHGGTP